MMKIIWAPEALDDVASILDYVAEHDAQAAQRVVRRIFMAVETLRGSPEVGRPGRVLGTRELVITSTPYVVPYRVLREGLQILRIYHGARRWPDRF
jgi:toxin ParE1/3/4